MDKSAAARWLGRLLRCRRLAAVVFFAAGAAMVVVAAATLVATASVWSPQSEIETQLFFPGGEVQRERLSRCVARNKEHSLNSLKQNNFFA